jgi:lipoprotein signal peptidase
MRWIIFVVALLAGTILDLGTKGAAFAAFDQLRDEAMKAGRAPPLYPSIPVSSWFAITEAHNRGAAFGLFQGEHDFFMLVTLVALVAVPYFVHTAPKRARLMPLILGLILAGVVGNFWDRVHHGFVRDFLDVHTPPSGPLHDFFSSKLGRTVWPTFNVADIFITCGAIAMVLFFGQADKAAKKEAAAPPPAGDAPAPAPAPPVETPAPPVETPPPAPPAGEGPKAETASAVQVEGP